MNEESVKNYYNSQYKSNAGRALAVHDMAKAVRRFAGVIKGFRIENCATESKILDVGSGLGFYTKALASRGADVVGIDFSEEAITIAKANFPESEFRQASWPDGVPTNPQFDVIWMVNFSMMNTFDIQFINDKLIAEALRRLKNGGFLVIGWNTDFSGRTIDGYSHWPISMLRRMRKLFGLSAPIVPEVPVKWLSWLMIRGAYVCGRSIPVFMVRQKSA